MRVALLKSVMLIAQGLSIDCWRVAVICWHSCLSFVLPQAVAKFAQNG
jgi:hypothetical protein